MLKSITPHLPSLHAWRSDTSISMRSPASCFVGFRLDAWDIVGAGAVWMCACFVRSWNQCFSASCFSWLTLFILQVLRCRSRESNRAPQYLPVLRAKFGQYLWMYLRCDFPNSCFARYTRASLLIRRIFVFGTSWNIEVSLEPDR